MARIVSALGAAQGGSLDKDALQQLQLQLSAKIALTDQRAADAGVERANRLADGPDPEPLARTLRRLRHDIALLARALSEPLPDAARGLEEPLRGLLDALAAWLAALATALPKGEEAPGLDELKPALARFSAATAGGEPFDLAQRGAEFQRVFALLFLFEQILQNMADSADRTSELAEARRKGASRERPDSAPGKNIDHDVDAIHG